MQTKSRGCSNTAGTLKKQSLIYTTLFAGLNSARFPDHMTKLNRVRIQCQCPCPLLLYPWYFPFWRLTLADPEINHILTHSFWWILVEVEDFTLFKKIKCRKVYDICNNWNTRYRLPHLKMILHNYCFNFCCWPLWTHWGKAGCKHFK